MPRKPEPKITVKYVENNLSVKDQKIMYKKFIRHIVAVVKEREAIDKTNINSEI